MPSDGSAPGVGWRRPVGVSGGRRRGRGMSRRGAISRHTHIAPPSLERDPGGTAAPATRVAGGAPGGEDEVGLRRGLRHEPRPVVEDEKAAIEAFAELDATAGIGAPAGPARDLDPASAEADGVKIGRAHV